MRIVDSELQTSFVSFAELTLLVRVLRLFCVTNVVKELGLLTASNVVTTVTTEERKPFCARTVLLEP